MRTVFVLSALSLLFGSSADDKVIGRVFDSSSKNPISNVNIYFPKEKVGATTDLNGNFQIEYKFDFPTTMEVAHIGYQTLYQIIDKNSSIDFEDLEGRRYYLSRLIDKIIARFSIKNVVYATYHKLLPKRKNYNNASSWEKAIQTFQKNRFQ